LIEFKVKVVIEQFRIEKLELPIMPLLWDVDVFLSKLCRAKTLCKFCI